jgi:hypothetical protein
MLKRPVIYYIQFKYRTPHIIHMKYVLQRSYCIIRYEKITRHSKGDDILFFLHMITPVKMAEVIPVSPHHVLPSKSGVTDTNTAAMSWQSSGSKQ